MAANTKSIIFKITEAGKQAALDAQENAAQIKINLTQVAVGTGKRIITGNETALLSEVKRSAIVSGDIEVNSNTLRFTSPMNGSAKTDVYEVGLFTDAGVLFAVASSTDNPLFSLHPDITFVIGFGLSLQDVAADSVTVTTDPNGALAIVIMEQHLAAPDPHPQYLNKDRFQFAMRALYPIGYQYHSHEAVNPKPIFDDILGVDTAWRRITGKIIIASDPNDPFINDHSIVLGQRGMTDLASSGQRPHVYPLQTTHLFERYDPNSNIDTVWNVRADKNSIGEGGNVRFTVTANNLPDGQSLDWTVKEGVLDSANNNITSPEKTDQGQVTLTNGQAIINYTTTEDDNEVEPQKHVRLTVGAPANLSINVPINDLGNTESIVHIAQSTTNGIQLDEYYKQQSGSYPAASDKIRFIVDEGVDIIAPDTQTPALVEGANWPTGNTPIVENHGRILGRGGDGGRSAEYQGGQFVNELPKSENDENWVMPENGKNGGVAVYSSKQPIIIENYNLVAGGGGGGAGGGAVTYRIDSQYNDAGAYEMVGGSGSGGGAPLGKRSPNANTIESYYKYSAAEGYTVFDYENLSSPIRFMIVQKEDGRCDFSPWWSGGGDTISKIIPQKDPTLKDSFPRFFTPYYESNGVDYKLISYEVNEDIADQSLPWVQGNGGRVYHNHSVKLRQSTDGTITSGGDYGYGGIGIVGANVRSDLVMPNYFEALDFSQYHGGSGGDLGSSGGTGANITKPTIRKLLGDRLLGDYAKVHEITPAAKGGLAGYVKEGNVTITNYGSGITKGR
tara:strand:- start:25551 stop:27914 length:2364 start_codon:yes stop_codon:yes gene_type:complete